MTSDPRVADLLVVGAGPAGMAAAVTALTAGLTVDLLDSGAEVGGQYWRHPPRDGRVLVDDRQHHDLGTYRALRRHLDHHAATGRLRLLLHHHVWTAERGPDGLVTVHAIDRSGRPGAEKAVRLGGRRLLVATGAFDRPLPFEGWDLPGVYTAGALQALLKGNAVTAGTRVVLGGTGPFLLPVAVGLARAGARVLAVCEAGSFAGWATKVQVAVGVPGKLVEGGEYAAELARHRISLLQRTAIVAASGADRVTSVTLARLDRAGQIVPGHSRDIAVDAVGVGWGFVPQLDLLVTLGCDLADGQDGNEVVAVDDSGRTSVAGVYAAGEVSGVGGAELALREGQLAAEAVLADAGARASTSGRRLDSVRGIVARHRAFAAAMHATHPVPDSWTRWLPDSATVCRCEEVEAGVIREAVADGADSVRQVKQLTRAGMGWCQGRMCSSAVDCLVGEANHTAPSSPARSTAAIERLVASPVPLGALAAETDG